MGQRLVTTVKGTDGNIISTVYYQWAGYTYTALSEAIRIIELFNDSEFSKISDERLRLIRIVESFGGGIDDDDKEYITSQFPNEVFKGNQDRNNGLVDLSINKMMEVPLFANYTSEVDFQNSIYKDNYITVDLEDVLNDSLESETPLNIETLKVIYFDLSNVHFDNIYTALSILNENRNNRYIYNKELDVYYEILWS